MPVKYESGVLKAVVVHVCMLYCYLLWLFGQMVAWCIVRVAATYVPEPTRRGGSRPPGDTSRECT
jgi:hypothetical protein